MGVRDFRAVVASGIPVLDARLWSGAPSDRASHKQTHDKATNHGALPVVVLVDVVVVGRFDWSELALGEASCTVTSPSP